MYFFKFATVIRRWTLKHIAAANQSTSKERKFCRPYDFASIVALNKSFTFFKKREKKRNENFVYLIGRSLASSVWYFSLPVRIKNELLFPWVVLPSRLLPAFPHRRSLLLLLNVNHAREAAFFLFFKNFNNKNHSALLHAWRSSSYTRPRILRR